VKIALVWCNYDRFEAQGAGYIASAVLDAGYELDFIDTAYTPKEEAARKLVAGRYDVVLLSSHTFAYPIARALASAVKTAGNPVVLLGGIHASAIPAKVLLECRDIDYVCVGEGEETVVEFLNALTFHADPHSIAGLGYIASEDRVVLNKPQPCTDLDTLPRFRHDLFDPRSIVQPGPLPGFCYVYATRGCPYHCSYCHNSNYLDMYGRAYLRAKRVDAVIQDMLYLKANYPAKFMFFGDEMALGNPPAYLEELFTRIHDEVQLPYGCMARVEHINSDLINLFRRTGCGYLGMGVECGDESFRREFLKRNMTNAQIIHAFTLARTIPGIMLCAYSMKGFPVNYDDKLTDSTRRLVNRVRPHIHQQGFFYPFPGTELRKYCERLQLIDPEAEASVHNLSSGSIIKAHTPCQ